MGTYRCQGILKTQLPYPMFGKCVGKTGESRKFPLIKRKHKIEAVGVD